MGGFTLPPPFFKTMSYFEVKRVNNSSLNYIDPELGGHPEKYLDYLNGFIKEESQSLDLGDIIHRALLLGETFVVAEKYPTEAIKSIIDEFYAICTKAPETDGFSGNVLQPSFDDDSLLLSVIRSQGYQNSYKDETVIKKVREAGNDYLTFLIRNTGKTIISAETSMILEKIKLSMNRPTVESVFLGSDSPDGDLEVKSELEIFFDITLEGYTHQCKAKLDRIIVDHQNKIIRLIDLKSTSGLLEYFNISVKRYKYHRQLAFYKTALEVLYPGYTIFPFIIAVETTNYGRARVFIIPDEVMEKGKADYESLLNRIKYHTETGNWIYPMEEEENAGIYLLELDI